MKKILFLFACAVVVLASCQKNNTTVTPAVALSATINGTNENFSSLDTARLINPDGSGIYVAGGMSKDTTAARILLFLTLKNPITVGTYSTTTGSSSSPIEIIYEPKGNTTANTTYYYSYGAGNYPCTINVTSISSTHVEATFTGTLILFSSIATGTLQTVTITDGKVNMDIK